MPTQEIEIESFDAETFLRLLDLQGPALAASVARALSKEPAPAAKEAGTEDTSENPGSPDA